MTPTWGDGDCPECRTWNAPCGGHRARRVRERLADGARWLYAAVFCWPLFWR